MKVSDKEALKELLKSTDSSVEFLEKLCKKEEETQTSDAFSSTPMTVVKGDEKEDDDEESETK